MARSMVSLRIVAAMTVALAVAGCAGGGASPGTGGSSGPSVAPPSAAPTAAVVSPTASPDGPAPSLGEPPVASLAVDGGDPVVGSLGSFTWGDGGSDSPWLRGAPIAVATGETLTMTLSGDVPIKDWTARRAPTGSTDGVGAVPLGAGGPGPIAFAAPPKGAWSVQIVVTFGDDLGAATYYWTVTVS